MAWIYTHVKQKISNKKALLGSKANYLLSKYILAPSEKIGKLGYEKFLEGVCKH